jgi:hypothetical protein
VHGADDVKESQVLNNINVETANVEYKAVNGMVPYDVVSDKVSTGTRTRMPSSK